MLRKGAHDSGFDVLRTLTIGLFKGARDHCETTVSRFCRENNVASKNTQIVIITDLNGKLVSDLDSLYARRVAKTIHKTPLTVLVTVQQKKFHCILDIVSNI